MAEALTCATSELILGGQKSGKSRRAEALASVWLAAQTGHRAILLATGEPGDEEMRQRIARHQSDRALRVPSLQTLEVPLNLAQAIAQHSNADTLLVVDCLTLWLTNLLMPLVPEHQAPDTTHALSATVLRELTLAISHARGPVVLVGNEIGLGVIPLGAQVRAFVDALGLLNQAVAASCQRVTLMAAGLALTLKDAP
jgi:adenosylcobinamide kinase/adenosylcobinamide-phosphate guanylyltransferase